MTESRFTTKQKSFFNIEFISGYGIYCHIILSECKNSKAYTSLVVQTKCFLF